MRRKKNILVLVSIVFGGVFIASLLLTGMIIHSPLAGKKLEAFLMHVEYLGADGVVFQKQSNDCGPSALQMVLDRFHIQSTVEELEQSIVLTERGTSMLALKELAEKKGLCVRGWKLTVKDLLIQPLPAILFVKGNHYVVVDSVRQSELYLRDPALGRIKMPVEQLPKIWGGETLILRKE